MRELIMASIDGVKSITSGEAVIGNAIHTPSGVTVIPVSKLSVGFAGGGIDLANKKSSGLQSLGSGSGSGVSLIPLAFLTVGPNAEVNLISINKGEDDLAGRVVSLIEKSPEILRKIKETF
ncbi:MAG: hypothetical protein J6Q69_07145 [Clostridia bacterium]|nr:hypothetical protein [Clostridia bacterium]